MRQALLPHASAQCITYGLFRAAWLKQTLARTRMLRGQPTLRWCTYRSPASDLLWKAIELGRQHLELVEYSGPSRFVCSSDGSNLLQQLFVHTANSRVELRRHLVFASRHVIHTDAHLLELFSQSRPSAVLRRWKATAHLLELISQRCHLYLQTVRCP